MSTANSHANITQLHIQQILGNTLLIQQNKHTIIDGHKTKQIMVP